MRGIRIDPSLLQMEIDCLTQRDVVRFEQSFGQDVHNWIETYQISDPHRPGVITVGIRLKRL